MRTHHHDIAGIGAEWIIQRLIIEKYVNWIAEPTRRYSVFHFRNLFSGEPHYEKAEKVPRSDCGVKICIAILTVTVIVSLGMAAAGLALYFKVHS